MNIIISIQRELLKDYMDLWQQVLQLMVSTSEVMEDGFKAKVKL